MWGKAFIVTRNMVSPVIAIVVAFFAGSQLGPSLGGKVLSALGKVPHEPVNRWLDHGHYNLEGCKLVFENLVEGCEDIVIHGEEAFLACGNVKGRQEFFPGTGDVDYSTRKDWHEPAFKLNLRTGKLEELERVGYNGDTIHHGIALWEFKDDPSKINLFFVNHIRNASCITIYEYKIGGKELTFLKNSCHPKILTPNSVCAAGPLSFYYTNDHRYRSGPLRKFEDGYGPFDFHEVGYCDASGSGTQCKMVIKGGLQYPNGITTIDDGTQLLVADSLTGIVSRYAINPATHGVTFQEKIDIGSALDNLRNIPNSRDVLVAGFPELKTLFPAIHHPDDPNFTTQEAGFRITPAKLGSGEASTVKLVYWDDSSLLDVMTVIATDERHGVTLGGGVMAKGIVLCAHSV